MYILSPKKSRCVDSSCISAVDVRHLNRRSVRGVRGADVPLGFTRPRSVANFICQCVRKGVLNLRRVRPEPAMWKSGRPYARAQRWQLRPGAGLPRTQCETSPALVERTPEQRGKDRLPEPSAGWPITEPGSVTPLRRLAFR